MKQVKFISLALLVIVILSVPSMAQANVCTWAESKNWGVSAPGKLTRGLFNTGLGWTNLFVQPFREETVMGGIGKGMSEFFVRTLQGVGELLLFWIPPAPEESMKECVFYDWGMLERQPL
ncbi:MAG: hypothetical protein HY582_04985 [Candidatus Omnitrophica bacterium]|nr:hypothetical protein [Candidatus Omnitrophota bacterium]